MKITWKLKSAFSASSRRSWAPVHTSRCAAAIRIVMMAARRAARRLRQRSGSLLVRGVVTPDPEGPDPLHDRPQPHRRVTITPT